METTEDFYTQENLMSVTKNMIQENQNNKNIAEVTFNLTMYQLLDKDLLGSDELGKTLDEYISKINKKMKLPATTTEQTQYDSFMEEVSKKLPNSNNESYNIMYATIGILDNQNVLKDDSLLDHINNNFLSKITTVQSEAGNTTGNNKKINKTVKKQKKRFQIWSTETKSALETTLKKNVKAAKAAKEAAKATTTTTTAEAATNTQKEFPFTKEKTVPVDQVKPKRTWRKKVGEGFGSFAQGVATVLELLR